MPRPLQKVALFSFVILLFLTEFAFAAPTPLPPLRILRSGSAQNPVVIAMTGVEQDPVPVAARWDESCWADLMCFLSSQRSATASADLSRMLRLFATAEDRAELQRGIRDLPNLLARTAELSRAVTYVGLLGWIDYGEYRCVLMVHEAGGSADIATLTIRKVNGRWQQTYALAAHEFFNAVAWQTAKDVLSRHPIPANSRR